MSWTKVEVNKPHRCEKPYYVGEGVESGEVIRCDECAALWKCVGVDYGMQWDPFPQGVLKWEQLK